jgi:urease accessory protein
MTLERPDDGPFARDTLRIDPSEASSAIGRFGDAAAVATLLVVAPGIGPELIRDAIGDGTRWGASALPDGAGVWLRVLGPDARSVMSVVMAARAAVRTALLGSPPVADRRP